MPVFSVRFRAVAATFAVVAGLVSVSAAEATREIVSEPTLAVAAPEPLPGALRQPVPGSVAELRAIQDRVGSLVESLRAVTVGIQVGRAFGSGVIVSGDGYVLTAAHVCGPPGRSAIVTLSDGTRLDGVTLGRETEYDAGLVKITERRTLPVAKVGDVESLEPGDWVIATGHPGGYDSDRPPVVRLGRVLLEMKAVLQTDCTLVGGDSGGPLFDLNGRVVGIHSRIGPPASFNFHVPISAYTGNWYWLVRSEERPVADPGPGGPMIAVDGEDVADGCRLTRVFADGPADKAGLAERDVVLRLGGTRVHSIADLVATVGQHRAGERIEVLFRRGEATDTTTVTLAARPERRKK